MNYTFEITGSSVEIKNIRKPFFERHQKLVEPNRLRTTHPSSASWGFTINPTLDEPITSVRNLVSLDFKSLFYPSETKDLTTEVEFLLSTMASDGVVLQDPTSIRNYLHKYSDLVLILLPIYMVVQERLGSETQLTLQLYRDPEIEDEYLTLYARTNNYDQAYIDKVMEISRQVGSLLTDAAGWLLVTTDFRPPQ